MKQKILISLLFLILQGLVFSVKAEQGPENFTTEGSELTTFNNGRGDVEINYPKGWFIKQHKYNNPYTLFLSREKVEEPTDKFKVGITFYKFYHQSWYLGLDKEDNVASMKIFNDIIYDKEAQISGKRRLSEVTTNEISLSDGTPALKTEAVIISEDPPSITTYAIFAMKNDVLVYLLLEAPTVEFENYRKTFENIINSAKLFSAENDLSDNALLDKETEGFVIKGIAKLSGDDGLSVIQNLTKAKQMNPFYAKTDFMLGEFNLKAAQQKEGEDRDSAVKIAHECLTSATKLYLKYPEDYNSSERNIYIAQCYYLLGDINYFFYDNKEEAKKLYEQSLSYMDYPPAREKLEKYFNK